MNDRHPEPRLEELLGFRFVGAVSVEVLAELLGRRTQTIRNLLHKHRALLEPAMYDRDGSHPRKVRLLSRKDQRVMATLISSRAIRTLPVKKKVAGPHT